MVSGREIGKKIEKTGKKLQKNISEKIGQYASPAAINDAINEAIASRVSSAKAAAQHGLDQVLVNLEHRGLKIKESQELLNQLGHAVLTRAETVRSQLSQNPLTPEWLKDITSTKSSKAPLNVQDRSAEATSSVAEATVSKAAEGMQPVPMKDLLEEEEEAAVAKKSSKVRAAKSVPPKARAAKKSSRSSHASK